MSDNLILVVEDDAAVMRMLHTWLLAEGHVPYPARNFKDGLAEIQSGRQFSVAIIDVRLPDGDGLDLVRKLTLIAPHTHTIVITALPDDDVWARAKEAGANNYLPKPFVVTDLRDVIDRGIEYHEELAAVGTCVDRCDRVLGKCQLLQEEHSGTTIKATM